ncbi:MAG TPA: MlaD family protein [Polyangia bacterium]|nr:MlaD family protein [Polyangia bacterium]
MRRSWASVTVGALVLVVLGISYFLVRSTSERSSGSKGVAVWALFHDASGLFEKSRVQTAGIAVGEIAGRELDPATARAKITIRMHPGITLYENAAVAKRSASLLGEFYLEIDPGTPFAEVKGQRREMRPLKDGEQIKNVREPVAMGEIMDNVGSLLPILHDILEDVRRLTSGTITDIADNVNKLIETNSVVLERLLSRMDTIAANVEGITTSEAGDVKESIKNVRDITESIKSLIGTTQGQVAGTGNKVQGSIDRLQTTLDNLDKSMHNIESITEHIDKGDGTIGHLVNDDTIARNVEDITENASTFVRGITKLQTVVGLRSEYNVLASTVKNYLSVTLMPRPDKFYLIELIEDPRGYSNAVTTATQSSSTGFSTAKTVTTSDQLRFTLMFGKRVGAVAGRFGIKESTGGVGADLYLLDDQLALSVDVFNFAASNVNQYPRVKTTVAYNIYNKMLYLVAGADDILNFKGLNNIFRGLANNTGRGSAGAGGGFDYFIGAQLSFNDEDLKSLLLMGGGSAAGAASK